MFFSVTSPAPNSLYTPGLDLGIQNQLGTAEQGDLFPTRFIRYLRVPDLGGPPVMEAGRGAADNSLAGGAQEIALQLDGGEVVGASGQIGDGPVAAGRVGQGDDRGGMQVAVGSQQLGAHLQAAGQLARFNTDEFDAEQAG
jgi:hypothetical protein